MRWLSIALFVLMLVGCHVSGPAVFDRGSQPETAASPDPTKPAGVVATATATPVAESVESKRAKATAKSAGLPKSPQGTLAKAAKVTQSRAPVATQKCEGYWIQARLSRDGVVTVLDTRDGRIPGYIISGGIIHSMHTCEERINCRQTYTTGLGLAEPFTMHDGYDFRQMRGFRTHSTEHVCAAR